MKTFEDIAAEQGWSESAQMQVMRRFIQKQNDEAALVAWAGEVAAFENTGGDSAWG